MVCSRLILAIITHNLAFDEVAKNASYARDDNPVRSLAIAFERDSFLDKYSKIFIVFGEHRSFISVHLIVTLSLLIATLSLLISFAFLLQATARSIKSFMKYLIGRRPSASISRHIRSTLSPNSFTYLYVFRYRASLGLREK